MNIKLLSLVSITLLTNHADMHANSESSIEEPYTHKITVTFTVEVSPKNTEEWSRIKALFDPVRTQLECMQEDDACKMFLKKLDKGLEEVPAYCKERGIHGQVHINVGTFSPNEDE